MYKNAMSADREPSRAKSFLIRLTVQAPGAETTEPSLSSDAQQKLADRTLREFERLLSRMTRNFPGGEIFVAPSPENHDLATSTVPVVVFERILKPTVDSEQLPKVQEELITSLLERADRGESRNLRDLASEIREKRPQGEPKNRGKVLGMITAGLYNARNTVIGRLEQHLSEPDALLTRVYAERILDAAHTVSGHEGVTAQDLLDLLKTAEAPARPPKKESTLGDRTRSIVLARLRPNETHTGRAHKTWYEVVEESHVDSLEAVPESERKQKIQGWVSNAYGAVAGFIGIASREDTNPRTHCAFVRTNSVLAEVRSLGNEYARLTNTQIFEMLRNPRLFPKVEDGTGEVRLVRVVETKPVRPLREELVIGLLRRADQGESLDLLDLAEEIYEKRPHDDSMSKGESIRGIVAGLAKARTAVIERLEQYSPDQHLLRINAYVERVLDVAHTISGHEAMTAQELLDFQKRTETVVPPAAEETVKHCMRGDRLKRQVFASLEPNANNTDLRYKSRMERTTVAISDLLEGRSRRKRAELLKSHVGGLKTTIDRFVRILREPTSVKNKNTQERYRQILAEARARWSEVYGNSSDEEMIAILAGELSFPDFAKRNWFSQSEAHTSSPVPVIEHPEIPVVRPATEARRHRERGEPGTKRQRRTLPHETVWRRSPPVHAEPRPQPPHPEPERRRQKTELERIEELYGNRRARVLDSLLERNEAHTALRFPTIDQAVEDVYKDIIAKCRNALNLNQKLAGLKHTFAVEREYYVQILTDYIKQPDGPNKEAAEALLKEAADQLGYNPEMSLSPVRLIRILRRHIDEFTDIYNPDPKLDEVEWNEGGDTIITKRTELKSCGTGEDAGRQLIRSRGDDGLVAAVRESRIAVQD